MISKDAGGEIRLHKGHVCFIPEDDIRPVIMLDSHKNASYSRLP